MKYYLIAGEASGDLHASNLIRGLKKFDPGAEFRYFGGDRMQKQGGVLVRHYSEMAYMGLVDVLLHLRTIMGNMSFCRQDIREWKPDAIILVDFAGFNLRIAEFAHKSGIKVFFYISPKVWVWKKSRIEKLRKYTHRLFVIFPFEVPFFRENQLEVEYYGNPLMDSLHEFRKKKLSGTRFLEENLLSGKPVIALLSGSRKDEIKRCLPEMIKLSRAYPEFHFAVAGAPSISDEYYRRFLRKTRVKLVHDQTYQLLDQAWAAVVTSGTATLETAIFKVPQVVVYKTSPVNYRIGRLFIKIRFFSLVNLIAGKEVVRELLQDKVRTSLPGEFSKILDAENRKRMIQDYEDIRISLGENGCSERIAARITELMGII